VQFLGASDLVMQLRNLKFKRTNKEMPHQILKE
jgi:hypothetical protein